MVQPQHLHILPFIIIIIMTIILLLLSLLLFEKVVLIQSQVCAVLKVKKVLLLMCLQQPNIFKQQTEFIYLTVFLSRVFINKVLPMTKAVANYEDYPVTFYKTKSKLYRISLAPKRNNMFIKIIAAIDSGFCFQIWFCHVFLKSHCNSLLLLNRLTRAIKKNCKKRRSKSETESATEIVGK